MGCCFSKSMINQCNNVLTINHGGLSSTNDSSLDVPLVQRYSIKSYDDFAERLLVHKALNVELQRLRVAIKNTSSSERTAINMQIKEVMTKARTHGLLVMHTRTVLSTWIIYSFLLTRHVTKNGTYVFYLTDCVDSIIFNVTDCTNTHK